MKAKLLRTKLRRQSESKPLDEIDLIKKQTKLLDLAHDTIMVRDLNDIIVFWNQGAEQLYGWSRKEALGKYVHTFLQTIFPQPFEELRKSFIKNGFWNGVLVHTTRAGRKVYVESRWTLDRDESGQAQAYLEINNDITERKLAEEALQSSRDELETKVSERTRELSEANDLLRNQISEREKVEVALRDSEFKLRALSARLLSAQEEERRNISRELHDDLGQILTAINLDLQRAVKASNSQKRLELLRQILGKNDEARSRIREISSLLRPGLLDDLGIREAIESYVSQFVSGTGIPVDLIVKCSSSDIPAEATTTIYRIVQEALNNIAKYANANKVSVTLGIEGNQIQLQILDDGVGFDLSQVRTEHTLGLVGMRERARLLGGNFHLQASPGEGTSILVTLPVASWSHQQS
jgi:PAS domain S-box-containing protein